MLKSAEEIILEIYSESLKDTKIISDNCCNKISKDAFDFDEITAKYCKSKSITHIPPSVDLVYFEQAKEEILLVEFTSISEHCKSKGRRDDKTCLAFVKNELSGRSVRDKINYTLHTIFDILAERDSALALYVRTCKRKNLLVMDMTAEEESVLNLAVLNQLENVTSGRFEGNITICSCESFSKMIP